MLQSDGVLLKIKIPRSAEILMGHSSLTTSHGALHHQRRLYVLKALTSNSVKKCRCVSELALPGQAKLTTAVLTCRLHEIHPVNDL